MGLTIVGNDRPSHAHGTDAGQRTEADDQFPTFILAQQPLGETSHRRHPCAMLPAAISPNF
jgi:hypothetical protein